MKKSPLLTAFAALLLLLTACTKNKTNLSIPKDAAFVFHVNPSSLSSKLSWEEIKASGWFKESYQQMKDDYAQKLMDNPDSSGIDTQKDFAFFMQRKGNGGYGVFEGSIKNAAAFATLCKTMNKEAKAEKSGDWNLMTADQRTVIAWDDNRFAVITDFPVNAMNPMGNSFGEKTRFTADSLKIFVKEVMSASGSESLFDDDRFADMVKEGGDMHIWMNSSSMYSDLSGMLSMMKIGNLLSGNVSATTLNFDEGKISMNTKNFMGKEMTDMLKKWESKKVEAAVLNRIPSNDVIGVMAANVDPQSLQAFFKAVGFDGLINMMLAKQNMTMAEIFAATQGQFVLAFSDLSMQNKTVTLPSDDESDQAAYTYTTTQPDFNVLFASSVAQKASFENLMGAITKDSPALPFSYKLSNDWFVASNKTETVDGFMANKSTAKPFADKISGHAFGMYLDLQRLLKTNFTEETNAKGLLAESAATWQDVIVTGGEMKNGAVMADMVINLVDKKTNSLKQLNRYIQKMYESTKKNRVAYESNDTIVDTTEIVPPVVTSPE
jgi:hypothetical protein